MESFPAGGRLGDWEKALALQVEDRLEGASRESGTPMQGLQHVCHDLGQCVQGGM